MENPIARSEALTTHHDNRGDVTELIHGYDLPQVKYLAAADNFEEGKLTCPVKKVQVGQFGQTYIVRNEQAGTIRAFHKHEKLWDYFTIVNGKAQVWVVAPDESRTQHFILSAGNMSRLTIPPGWWHGWESLMPNTIMVCTGSEVYDREKPDEERVAYNIFHNLGVRWGVAAR